MTASRLLIVEPTLISARPLVQAARSLGFEPVLLCQRGHYAGDSAEALSLCGVHDVDTDDEAALLDWARGPAARGVGGVYTPADRFLPQSVALAAALRVPGPDPAVRELNDKGHVCGLVPEFGPPHHVFAPGAPDFERLRALAREHGAVVFKPTRSAGARGVFEAEAIDEPALLERLAREQRGLPRNPAWVAQARLPGALASLEGHIVDGRIVVLGHSLRRKVGKAESINHFPAAPRIASAHRERMLEAVSQLVRRSGFRQGFFHSEFIVGARGCHLIDANFGRLAGSGLGVQIGWSFGLSPEQTYAAAIDECVFHGRLLRGLSFRSAPQPSLAIHYGVEAPTVVNDLRWRTPAGHTHHHRFRDLGAEVPALSQGSSALVGVVIGLEAEALRTVEGLELATPHGPMKPFHAGLADAH